MIIEQQQYRLQIKYRNEIIIKHITLFNPNKYSLINEKAV